MQLSRRGHGCDPGHCSPDTQVWTTGASQLAQAQKEPSMCSGDDASHGAGFTPETLGREGSLYGVQRELTHGTFELAFEG